MAPSNKSSRKAAKAAKTTDALTAQLLGKHRRHREDLDPDSDDDPDFAPDGVVSDEDEEDDGLYEEGDVEDGDGDGPVQGDGEESDGEESDGEESDGEESDGEAYEAALDPSMAVLMASVLKELKASRKVAVEQTKILKGLAPNNASTANHPANRARKAKRDARNDPPAGPNSLPLDGSTRHFKGWRAAVVKALFPAILKAIGARCCRSRRASGTSARWPGSWSSRIASRHQSPLPGRPV